MPFDWDSEDDRPPQLPVGTYEVEVVRVLYGNAAGPFVAPKSGAPMIRLVLRDARGNEGLDIIVLSDNPQDGSWKLKQYLHALGLDTAAMTRDGVMPSAFAEPTFCEPNLLGRKMNVQVSQEPGRQWPKIVPIYQRTPKDTPKTDIPF